jgi:hypothetical protein
MRKAVLHGLDGYEALQQESHSKREHAAVLRKDPEGHAVPPATTNLQERIGGLQKQPMIIEDNQPDPWTTWTGKRSAAAEPDMHGNNDVGQQPSKSEAHAGPEVDDSDQEDVDPHMAAAEQMVAAQPAGTLIRKATKCGYFAQPMSTSVRLTYARTHQSLNLLLGMINCEHCTMAM